jgi:hypothetical protein
MPYALPKRQGALRHLSFWVDTIKQCRAQEELEQLEQHGLDGVTQRR